MKRAFTLIELLVVTAVMATLLGILLPVTGRARTQAKVLAVNAELRDIGLALEAYSFDHDHTYPPVRVDCMLGGHFYQLPEELVECGYLPAPPSDSFMAAGFEDRFNPGLELAHAEGFGDVVVGAEFEPFDPLGLRPTGGQHDDRHVRHLTDALEHLPSVNAGHHHIEADEIGMGLVELPQTLAPLLGLDDAVAVSIEVKLQSTYQCLIVIDDEQFMPFLVAQDCAPVPMDLSVDGAASISLASVHFLSAFGKETHALPRRSCTG